jgi:predicted porin
MKKTIIAASIAASFVAPAAFAEVSISGMVNPEFIDQDSATTGYTVSGVNTDLVFKASEDLGNGMKATAKYHQFVDTNDTNGAPTTNADMSVTVSGDFGSVVLGRFEPASEGVMDAFMNIDASHDLDLEDNTNAIGRTNNGMAYSSPSFNGLTVGIGSFAGVSGSSDDTDFSGADEIFVKYSNAGLTVMANNTEVDGGAKHNSIAVSYKMGDLELRAMDRNTEDSSGTASDSEFYGVKYTMGANTFAAGMLDETAANTDVEIYSASHALSKNTSVYVTVLQSDVAGEDKTAFGIVQKF